MNGVPSSVSLKSARISTATPPAGRLGACKARARGRDEALQERLGVAGEDGLRAVVEDLHLGRRAAGAAREERALEVRREDDRRRDLAGDERLFERGARRVRPRREAAVGRELRDDPAALARRARVEDAERELASPRSRARTRRQRGRRAARAISTDTVKGSRSVARTSRRSSVRRRRAAHAASRFAAFSRMRRVKTPFMLACSTRTSPPRAASSASARSAASSSVGRRSASSRRPGLDREAGGRERGQRRLDPIRRQGREHPIPVREPRAKLLGRRVGHELPGVDERDPVAVVGLLEEVRRHEHGDALRPPPPGSAPRRAPRLSTSTPAVGSSRKSRRGRWSVASARPARWRMPAGRSSGRSPSASASAIRSRTSPQRSSSACALDPVEARVELDVFADRETLVEAHLLAHVADAVAHAARLAEDVDAVELDLRPRSA